MGYMLIWVRLWLARRLEDVVSINRVYDEVGGGFVY